MVKNVYFKGTTNGARIKTWQVKVLIDELVELPRYHFHLNLGSILFNLFCPNLY